MSGIEGPEARVYDLSKYTKPVLRKDKEDAPVGLCGMGRDTQYIVYDSATGSYSIFNEAGQEVAADRAIKAAEKSINKAFNDACQRLAESKAGVEGYEQAEVTVLLTDEGMQLGFADPMPGRRKVPVSRARPTWLEAFLFVITLTAYRPASMQ